MTTGRSRPRLPLGLLGAIAITATSLVITVPTAQPVSAAAAEDRLGLDTHLSCSLGEVRPLRAIGRDLIS